MTIYGNVNILHLISNHNGFAINTDIFETNIVNLSVVIGILVYYGRIVLDTLKFNRS